MADLLLSTLGYSLFSKLKEGPEEQIFYCDLKNVDARGVYREEGFAVLKGSQAIPIKSEEKDHIEFPRRRLVEDGLLKQEGGFLVFQRNHTFKTPSKAAIAILGHVANGNQVWKNGNGKTLGFFAPK